MEEQLFPDNWNEMTIPERRNWWTEKRQTHRYPPMGDVLLGGTKVDGEDLLYTAPPSGQAWTLVLYTQLGQPSGYRWESRQYTPKPERASVKVLNEAADIITGDRLKQYGPPEDNFRRIVDYWNVWLADNPPPLRPSDAAMLMVFVKIAREAQGHKRDDAVDGAAYFALYEELRQLEEGGEE